ncbi:MAG: hypothetical protein LBG19_00440 [Prevotellaceae bacterium]|nr:hypothetical protein [Prevotellaceae bacterium]
MLILLMFSIHRYTYKEINILQHRSQLTDDMQAAILLLEKGVYPIKYDEVSELQLGHSGATIEIIPQQWGLFDIIHLYGKRSGLTDTLSILTGDYFPSKDSACLYVADHNNYLSITGDTHLEGTCYLPAYGITKAYVEGISYSGDTLVFGSIQTSERNIPKLQNELLKRHEKLFSTSAISSNTIPDSLFVPYVNKETALFYYPTNAHLSAKYIGGNVIIICDSTLTILSDAHLDGCIVAAHSIVIEKGFTGRFQGFSRQSIDVEDGTKLLFPSVLFINGSDNANMRIGLECFLCGIFIVNGKNYQTTHLQVGLDTILEGIVYNSGTTELKGDVWGELYTERFLFRSQFNQYDDFLLNVEISKPKLSEHFVGINLFNGCTTKPMILCHIN